MTRCRRRFQDRSNPASTRAGRVVAGGAGVVGVMLIGAVLLMAGTVRAYPEPAVVNPSWSLDFEYETPQVVEYRGRDGQTRYYWYMPYKVTNNTGRDRIFVPEIVILKDTGEIRRAGEGVPAAVFNKVKNELNNPLLEQPIQIVGRLLTGRDQARESVAIWPVSDEDVDRFSVFVGGIHGETQKVPSPLDPDDREQDVLMRRTKWLVFEAPGTVDDPRAKNRSVRMMREQDTMR